MRSFIKKDLLVFWRDRKEVLLALLLPVALILVLSFSMSGLFNEGEEMIEISVAITQEDNEARGLEQFEEKVNRMDLTPEENEHLLAQAVEMSPVSLIYDFLESPDMEEWITVHHVTSEEAIQAVEEGELDAIIMIPEGFTFSTLSSIFLGEDAGKMVSIHVEEESNEANALHDMVANYFNTLNLQFALGSANIVPATDITLPEGGREVVEGAASYTIVQFFTVAMAALFSLFIAQTVATKTATEKRERVFNRIMLTNRKASHYLMGKVASTFLLVMVQLVTTFTITQLLLNVFPDKSLQFWLGTLLVITIFAIAVSGLSALFTPITLRLEDSNATNGVLLTIVLGLGMLGGSFFPIDFLPERIQRLGAWTPNGLMQGTILKWIQYGSSQELFLPIVSLLGFFVVCFLISLFLFPRRERV